MKEDLNELVGRLSAEGSADSEGQFTLAPEKALQKLRESAQADGTLMLSALLAAAVQLGAKSFDVRQDGALLQVNFEGRLPEEEFWESPFRSLLGVESSPAERDLAFALLAATSSDKTNLKAGAFELAFCKGRRELSEVDANSYYSLKIEGGDFKVDHLPRVGLYAPLTLLLDGKKRSRQATAKEVWWRRHYQDGSPELWLELPSQPEPVRGSGVSGFLAITESTWASSLGLTLVVDGVAIRQDFARKVGHSCLCGVIAAPGLKRDINFNQVVEDEAFEALLEKLRGEAHSLMMEFLCYCSYFNEPKEGLSKPRELTEWAHRPELAGPAQAWLETHGTEPDPLAWGAPAWSSPCTEKFWLLVVRKQLANRLSHPGGYSWGQNLSDLEAGEKTLEILESVLGGPYRDLLSDGPFLELLLLLRFLHQKDGWVTLQPSPDWPPNLQALALRCRGQIKEALDLYEQAPALHRLEICLCRQALGLEVDPDGLTKLGQPEAADFLELLGDHRQAGIIRKATNYSGPETRVTYFRLLDRLRLSSGMESVALKAKIRMAKGKVARDLHNTWDQDQIDAREREIELAATSCEPLIKGLEENIYPVREALRDYTEDWYRRGLFILRQKGLWKQADALSARRSLAHAVKSRTTKLWNRFVGPVTNLQYVWGEGAFSEEYVEDTWLSE